MKIIVTRPQHDITTKNKFEVNFNRLLSSNADQDSLQAAQFLRWNMMHQVCLGDGEAKL